MREMAQRGTHAIGTGLLLLFFTFGCAGLPGWMHRLGYTANELSPIRIGKFGFPIVAGKVNQRPVSLVFDTGNMVRLLLATRVINDLRLPSAGMSRMFDADGTERASVRRVSIAELEVFGQTFPGEFAVEDTPDDLEGFVGPGYVIKGRFTLDYRGKWFAVSTRPSEASLPEAIPLHWSDSEPGMIVIGGEANGTPVLLQLDTGKSRTCVDPALARQLGLPRDGAGVRGLTVKIASHSFSIAAAKEVGFGAISTGYPGPILVGVGSDVLSKGVLTVDYPRRIVSFER